MKDELLTNFIPINRGLFEHHLWCEEREFSRFEAWLYLLKEARFEDTKLLDKGKLVIVKRGQVYISYRFLAGAFGWTVKRVRTFLDLIESDNMIERDTAKGTGQTIITICNYNTYNVRSLSEGTARGTQGARKGHAEGTKSNTVNTDNNISIIIKGEQKLLKHSLFQTLDILLKDESWIEVYLMNNGFHPNDKELFCDYLKSFFILEQDRGETYKTEKDAKQHFVNWLRLILEEQAKKQARKKQTGGGLSRNQSQPISKVGSMLDIVGELLHPQN